MSRVVSLRTERVSGEFYFYFWLVFLWLGYIVRVEDYGSFVRVREVVVGVFS